MSRFHVQNFGCRASQADGAALEAQLLAAGMTPAESAPGADLVILNTCTVTANADADLRQAVRRIHRENAETRIVVTGCYAQRAPQEIAALPGVSLVVGNSHKAALPALVQLAPSHAAFHGQVVVGDIFADHQLLSPSAEALLDRARPNLKIQDGCNNRCSFCIIPFVRGRSRSVPAERIVQQVRQFSQSYAEIVLTGINLGRWGRELGAGRAFEDLLRLVLAETDVRRLRLSSVEPMDWSDGLIELMAMQPRIARHIHMPLQSGSDSVLRRMYRKYRTRHYRDRLQLAYSQMPEAALGADVMTGFPGETEAEFAESLAFIESLPFTYLNVFTYSEREGTRAALDLDAAVPMAERKRRTRILRELSERRQAAFHQRLAGRRLSAVTLLSGDTALSSNYATIQLAERRPPGSLIEVDVMEQGGGLREQPRLA